MTAPDMEGVIAAALEDHSEVELEQRVWTCICGHEFGLITDDTCPAVEHREHQATAVLAAISEAGFGEGLPQEVIGAKTLRAAAESFRLASERSFSGLDVAEILEASAETIEVL